MLKSFQNLWFMLFHARRAARFLCQKFPSLGLEADKVLVLASSGPRAGVVTLSGMGIVKFEYDLWLEDKWRSFVVTLKRGRPQIQLTIEGTDATFFEDTTLRDRRLEPVVKILKTVAHGYFPFHYTSTLTRDELAAKTGPLRG
jgi:hypothetical protein